MSIRTASRRAACLMLLTAGLSTVISACGSSDTAHRSSSSPSASMTAINGNNPQDAAFLEMMVAHHEQAIQMAQMVPSHTQKQQIRQLASKIEAAQGPEIAKMNVWLDEWNEGDPSATASDSGGTDHGGKDSGVPGDGMVTAGEMGALERARGAAFDRLWLQMMIKHHEGAVTLSQQELASGENAQVKALAQAIIDGQTKEITAMKQMLG